MKKLVVVLWYFMVLASLASTENSTDSVEKTFEFVNQKIGQLKLTKIPNITLVVGNTGSGKSTLVHYVAGDYSKLVSIEPVGDEIEYSMHDGLNPVVGQIVSTSVSRTLVPEMIIDDMGNVWYDCPGFGDTRSETVEIATTFLIKSVIENASNVKIVIVVNYASVTEGYDRTDFDRLMRHATQLIKNVDRYKESVSLVVSKAPSYIMRGRRSFEIHENAVKTSTTNFMRGYRLAQQDSGSNEKKIQLIDALLGISPNGDYPKISVFWRPSDAGAFDTIEKMVDGRQKIRNSILEHSSYTKIQPNDFGFPLTDAARIHITDMAEYVMNSFGNLLTNIDRNVARALRGKINSIDDFHDRLELLAIGKRSIQSNRRDVMTLKDLTDRFTALIKLCNTNSLDLRSDLNAIEQQEKNLNILKSIAQTDFAFPINDWIANTHETTDFVSTEHQWHSFLGQVYDFFAGHDVQRNVAVYNVADLTNWGQLEKPQGLTITANNFNSFTQRFPGNIEVTPSASRLKELNAIIVYTLKSPPQYECNGESMIIKGNFVKSSDIRSWKCPANRLSKITVFALSTFFVDTDLDLQGYKELNIFADKWELLQESVFNLNAVDREKQGPPENQGSAGKPGDSGMNAGNFFGLSNELVNGASLTVEQDGGDGADGQDGTSSSDVAPSFTRTKHEETGVNNFHLPTPDQYYIRFLKSEGYDAELTQSETWIKYITPVAGGTEIKHRFRIFPKHCCGATGLGGPGGVGGHPGYYMFLQIGNINGSSPKFDSTDGALGREGENARPCESTAIDVRINTYLHEYLAVLVPMYSFHSGFWIDDYVESGRCSSKYVSTTAAIPPPAPREPINVPESIIGYKAFLRENMRKSPFAKTARKMYDAIDLNPNISHAFAVADFAHELNTLESQYFELNEHVDFLPFYENMLKRIESSAIVHKEASDRTVLALLYTTVLSKKISMQSGHQSDLIIEIENFLDLTIQNVEETARIRVIEEHRNRYNEDLKAKIDEANDYIAVDIQPEIRKVFSTLDIEMLEVADETIALQANTIQEIKRKQKKAEIIRRNAFMRSVAGVADTVGKMISFMGPAGKFAAAMMSTGSAVVNEFLFDPKINKLEMPAGLMYVQSELAEQLKMNVRNTIDALESELNKLNDSMRSTNTEGFANQLDGLMSSVKSINSEDPFARDSIVGIVASLTELITKQLSAGNGTAPIVTQLKRTANALALIDISISMYRQFSDNEERLDAIGEAITQDRKALIALKELEGQIYAELLPMINALQGNLEAIERNLGEKSSVALEVQQWKVSGTLRSVQRKLVESIEGFRNAHGIDDCIAKIGEAFNLIIRIYDRIQNYQDQSKLAIYLSDLQTADYRDLDAYDVQIKELQFNLQANTILSQYNRAVDGFKQAVFPFAAEYLDIYRLPASFAVDKNLTKVIATATDNIKSLDKRIKELNGTVVNEDDSDIHIAHFNRDTAATRPFYVWPNNEVNDKVLELFAGKKIYLVADVTRSSHLNAVKFNIIDLQFRSSNQSINDQMNRILQSFHVSLTHMGESNYRCSNQFYTISTRPEKIEFSFSKESNVPVDRNSVYDKLSSSVKLLSPYTLWGIQLINGPFDELKPFANSVDIELHGHGQYVSEGVAICNTDLGKYYSPMDLDTL